MAPARWLSVDPLAEKHPDWTPYHYVLANPLLLIDPDGRQEAYYNRNREKRLLNSATRDAARREFRELLPLALAVGAPAMAMSGGAILVEAGSLLGPGGILAVKEGTAAMLELTNDSPADIDPTAVLDNVVKGLKQTGKLGREAGSELAPLLLGHNMRRIVKPIAKAQGFITLNPQGANFTETVIDNLNLLHKEFISGRRIFLIDNGTSNFIEAEKAFLRNLSGVKRINVGTIETPDGVFDLYEYVRIE